MRSGERLVYLRPDGVKYPLHTMPQRTVLSEEGLGMPPIEYVTDRAPFQHGNTVRSYHLNPRAVQLVVLQNFCSRAEYWSGRNALIDAIRPSRISDFNNPGKLLYYRSGGTKRQLDVVVESGPGFAPPQGGWRAWSFTEVLRFIAPDPTWYDPAQQSASFAGSAPATFPMTFPVTFTTFGKQASVQYSGTWIEYPSFTVVGPILGLRILNETTGKQIQLAYSLPAGLSLTITLRGRTTILRSDGVNLLNYVTADSDLTEFSLVPEPEAPGGINVITVIGSATTVATTATMNWYSRYLGI